MREVAGNRHFTFQQDGEPCHTAKCVQNYLKETVPSFWEKEIWPASSPDLNPLDYYVWSVC